jgi:putative SOS response-associated peptidase YedK
MCGRYLFDSDGDIEEVTKILLGKSGSSSVHAKTGEVYPTNDAAILSMIDGKPSLGVMKWGFPKWDKKGVIINARSETAAQKKTFEKPLAERRCVIPSTGFFEWRRDSKGKASEKLLFNVSNERMLYMAGVYSENADGARFVILTRAANDSISDIHNRMPVILDKSELVRWMTDQSFIQEVFSREDVCLVKKTA